MAQRIATGVLAGGFFAAVLWLGGWFYTALMLLMALIGFSEYVKMNGQRHGRWDVLAAYAAVALLTLTHLPAAWNLALPGFEAIAWGLMFLLLLATVFSKNTVNLQDAALLFLGAVYIGAGFHFMLATRELEHGLFWSLITFVCIWASDSGAYFTGRMFGRTKLWPAISPNKTVEGAAGGLVLSIIAALIFALARPDLLGYGQAVAIGLAAAAAGQLGDLIQSAYKRLRGVKDSGHLLPGHGGILDRTDSWLIVFPLVHMLSLVG
jgi:phosphatidate cytidylyltransferase